MRTFRIAKFVNATTFKPELHIAVVHHSGNIEKFRLSDNLNSKFLQNGYEYDQTEVIDATLLENSLQPLTTDEIESINQDLQRIRDADNFNRNKEFTIPELKTLAGIVDDVQGV